jgi:hypothetical protein
LKGRAAMCRCGPHDLSAVQLKGRGTRMRQAGGQGVGLHLRTNHEGQRSGLSVSQQSET